MFAFLSNFMMLILGRAYFIWEAKPHCIGEPRQVGFVRDICVDIVARNIYSTLQFPVSPICEELANMQTSTGHFKVLKWKRSSKQGEKATNEELDKAKRLIHELLREASKNMPEKNSDMSAREILYEQTKDAKRRLSDSGAIPENSPIVDQLEDLKTFLCRHCAMMENQDMKDAIRQFIDGNSGQQGLIFSNFRVDDSIGHMTITGLFRLSFDIVAGANTSTGSAILKIPSLAPFYYTKWKNNIMYVREGQFYGLILPTLYQIGQCEPFAPVAFTITQEYALVLEDLSKKGYVIVPVSESLDLEHSRIFLNALAQYHAFGYVYFNNLDENDPIKGLIGPEEEPKRGRISKQFFEILCQMVEPHLSEALYQKVLLAENEILAELRVQNENDQNSLNVIMHGDLHRKNFLFNYNSDGKVSGIKLIDWQVCTVGGAALELIEFFAQNVHEEIFEANEDYLLDYYISAVNHYLSLAQSNRTYNRLDLNRDLIFFKYYYFETLSQTIFYWGAPQSSENYDLVANNIAKWIKYFEKKNYL